VFTIFYHFTVAESPLIYFSSPPPMMTATRWLTVLPAHHFINTITTTSLSSDKVVLGRSEAHYFNIISAAILAII
jgi:hypothetical protein